MEVEKLSKIETKREWLKRELEEDLEKKTPEFQQFLAEQVFLPKEKQDEKFKNYVEKKYKFWQENIRYAKECSATEIKERSFKIYLKYLDISENELKDKKILDLGCGKEGNFVKDCLEKGITPNIYGLDRKIEPDKFNKDIKQHFFRGDYSKKIPDGDYDYIISVDTPLGPSLSDRFEEKDVDCKKTISLALKSLKEDGEFRISHMGETGMEGGRTSILMKKWQNILKSLAKEKKIEYQFQPVDIAVSGTHTASGIHKSVLLEEVLIIKKKQK